MNRSNILLLALAGTSVQPLAAAAATDSDYYVNADVGLNFEHGAVRLDMGPDVLNKVPSNQHDFIWGLSLGEQFTRHFALEVGYRDLGSMSGSLVNAPGSSPATGSFRFTANGPTVALVGRLPFGRWEADLKLGSLIADSHLSTQVTDRFGTTDLHASTWNAGLFTEVGIGYRFGDHWNVSLDEATFSDVGRKYVTGRWNVRATMLRASYRF